MYTFPKDLYADVRIEETYNLWLNVKNGELDGDSFMTESGAIVRVFDGNMWYTSTTNKLNEIQQELDNLATLATPNSQIWEHPIVKKYQVNIDDAQRFHEDDSVRNIPRGQWKELLDGYIRSCVDETIPEILFWNAYVSCAHKKKSFYSGKGAAITQDWQECRLGVTYGITVDGVTTYGWKSYSQNRFEDLAGKEAEIRMERDRYLDFARNAVQLEPGEYTCVLAPVSTAMFVHESFGHKSEADFMLNDKTLQDEWVMGKKVGNDMVSICDRGDLLNHGYTPYDDEGTKAGVIWLMKDGILTGRLHDAKSAATLGEELTGNCRAQNYNHMPIVRMTNTFMEAGLDNPQEIIAGVKDGLYVYGVEHGTGMATFTIKPSICYRIRDGKICEPVRVNVLTGSVFETLFDVDAVGTDFELFDTYTCGKNGQSAVVSAGGPSIRVKKMTVN